MAIAWRSNGAILEGTANITPVIGAGAVAGDMMLLCYGTKPYDDAPTFSAGWVEIGSATDGVVAAGVDLGSMRTSIVWKEHDGSETDPVCTNATNNVSAARVIVYSKGAGETWDTPLGSGGGHSTADVNFSVTAASDVGHTVDDMVVGVMATRSDGGGITSMVLAATGLTLAAHGSSGSSVTALGGDMSFGTTQRKATAGTSSAPPVFTATLGAAHTGSAYMVRLRVTAAAGANPPYRNPYLQLLPQ